MQQANSICQIAVTVLLCPRSGTLGFLLGLARR